MKTLTILFISIFALMFLFCVSQLWEECKDGRKPSPAEDDLFILNYKIENAMMDDSRELDLLRLIKQYKLRPDIDQKKLKELEDKFRQRYQILHVNDVR